MARPSGEAEPKPSSALHDSEKSRPWIASPTPAMTAAAIERTRIEQALATWAWEKA